MDETIVVIIRFGDTRFGQFGKATKTDYNQYYEVQFKGDDKLHQYYYEDFKIMSKT